MEKQNRHWNLKLPNQEKLSLLNQPNNLGHEANCMIGLIILQVYNSFFNVNTLNNEFEL